MTYHSDFGIMEDEYEAEGAYLEDLIEAKMENAYLLYEYTPIDVQESFDE